MKQARIIGIILLILISLTAMSGCGLIGVSSAGSEIPAGSGLITDTVSSEEDEEAKKLLNEYFSVLFDVPSVDVYTTYTRGGIIPGEIREYIAEQTITEGDGNPEIGIHLPRYIGLNGMTIVGYEPVNLSGDRKTADVNSGFIAKNGENFLYFCKINAKAMIVPDSIFEESFRLQEDNSYAKVKDISPLFYDTIRVELRYDVELSKEGGKLKVLRAIESNVKPGLKNRLFIKNNENVTRLPYLDTSRTPTGNDYHNPIDGEIYEAEKAIISTFFENLSKLDRERMNLLSHKWEKGFIEVSSYWDSLGITKDTEGNQNIIEIDGEYHEKYPYEYLPLRYNMERIKELQNISVKLHPAYSEKQKWYFVQFNAKIQKINGITDEDFTYRYDYLVTLSESGETIIIDRIKLNEYYAVAK